MYKIYFLICILMINFLKIKLNIEIDKKTKRKNNKIMFRLRTLETLLGNLGL